jgi:hypothetical protein
MRRFGGGWLTVLPLKLCPTGLGGGLVTAARARPACVRLRIVPKGMTTFGQFGVQ